MGLCGECYYSILDGYKYHCGACGKTFYYGNLKVELDRCPECWYPYNDKPVTNKFTGRKIKGHIKL